MPRVADPLGVLVVDDDFRVAALHAEAVDAVPGLRVVARAGDAASALAAAAEHAPALVLLDRHLPDRDGLDVLRRLRTPGAAGTPPAVVVLSGDGDARSVTTAARLGALHYLLKPVDFGALDARLRAFVALEARRSAEGIVDQAEADGLLRAEPPPAPAEPAPGATAPTTRRVLDALRAGPDARSAVEVAEAVGVSRATAQRHLTTLVRIGEAALELRYGGAGRPEHRYRPAR